jgi:hypothetical protein
MAGHGRCPSPPDFALQAYLHAPRRPPLQGKYNEQCSVQCSKPVVAPLLPANKSASFEPGVVAAGLSGGTQLFRECGAAVLQQVLDGKVLDTFRESIENYTAAGGIDSRFKKYQVPGVRGKKRDEWVLPFKFSEDLLNMLGLSSRETKDARNTSNKPNGQLYHILHDMLSHPPAIEFVSLIAAWPDANAQPWHR